MPSKRSIVNGVLQGSTKAKGSPSSAKPQVTGYISSPTKSSYNGKWLRRTLDETKSVRRILSCMALRLAMQYVNFIHLGANSCVDVFFFVVKLWAIIYPIDMIKSRMQTDGFTPETGQKYKSTLDCVRVVWRTEGIGAFTRGLGPTLIRYVVFV